MYNWDNNILCANSRDNYQADINSNVQSNGINLSEQAKRLIFIKKLVSKLNLKATLMSIIIHSAHAPFRTADVCLQDITQIEEEM